MADIKNMIEEIKKMTVVELNDLVKAIEEEFGVSAAAMAVAAPAAGAGAAAEEEKSEFNVVLTEVGANKIAVIKVVREITGLGLAESKAMVDGAPSTVKEGIAKEAAEEMVKKFAEAGAKAELK
ncbi:MAG: 50S ribosomal protein L7/L12 [Clostridia bacterium]|nr:50S ribosomal protein L7/L12 [Clostridiales bacterium]MBQ7917663.1 50S ribosomal protein L7/L12 [Clostridia bacterium]